MGVDVRIAHGDIAAELAALRDQTVEHAQELRTLELQRLDSMNAGLWPQIRAGSPPAVTAAIRVSERRARLLGLDAPMASTTQVTGRLSVEAEAKLNAEREALLRLDVEELQALADASNQLFAAALAKSEARRTSVTVAALPIASVTIDAESTVSTTTEASPAPSAPTAEPEAASAMVVVATPD